MNKRKPRAYLTKKTIGHFMYKPVIRWVAYDEWSRFITTGKTKKECEAECRRYGYVPERA